MDEGCRKAAAQKKRLTINVQYEEEYIQQLITMNESNVHVLTDKAEKQNKQLEFPGSPVISTPHFHSQGSGVSP